MYQSYMKFLAPFLMCALSFAATNEGTFHVETRYGYHLVSPRDLAIHRNIVELTDKYSWSSRWQLATGIRAYADAAYAANSRYSGPIVTESSQEIRIRDLYLQYKGEYLNLRIGNQQVVWGEAFGSYYADIVNPKDLREFGMGSLEAQRLNTPMLNAKWITSRYSFQALYIPQPYLNLVPLQGSDFAFPFSRYFPDGTNLTINSKTTLPLSTANGEWGARFTGLYRGTDISLFFLSYFDRMPVYETTITSLSPLNITLDPVHHRIRSTGFTLTKDFESYLIRLETIYTSDRRFGSVQGASLINIPSDEVTGVVGVDLTRFESWKVGMQISVNHIIKDIAGLLRKRTRETVSLMVNGPIWKEHTIDTLVTYMPHDGSSQLRLSYGLPLTDQLEFAVTADMNFGSSNSEFGQYNAGSRAYLSLKGFFDL